MNRELVLPEIVGYAIRNDEGLWWDGYRFQPHLQDEACILSDDMDDLPPGGKWVTIYRHEVDEVLDAVPCHGWHQCETCRDDDYEELRAGAIARLRELLTPGTTVHLILRYESPDWLTEVISIVVMGPEGRLVNVSRDVSTALQQRFSTHYGGIIRTRATRLSHWKNLVSELSLFLWPEYACLGDNGRQHERCPSLHRDGNYDPSRVHRNEYALRQQWI